jgi:hypothetical protein
MPSWLSPMRTLDLPAYLEWLGDPMVLVGIGVASAALAVLSLLALPFLLARIPADYFRGPRHTTRPGGARWFGHLLKNVFGVALLLAGIAMLVLPGQGILTIIAALVFLEFPGKRRFEKRLVGNPRVLKAINLLRARTGHPPLELDPADDPGNAP